MIRPPAPWSIVNIDLADGIGPFGEGVDRPCFVIFRYKGAVLGYEHLMPSDLPLTAAEHARLAARAVAPAVAELLRLHRDDDLMVPVRIEPDPLRMKGALLQRLDALLAERRSRPITLSASIVICT